MPRRHAVGVALCHRLHGPTVVQWRKAMSMPEGIDRVGRRRRAEGREGNGGEDVLKREVHGLGPSTYASIMPLIGDDEKNRAKGGRTLQALTRIIVIYRKAAIASL
jgi:hypothetical protein